MRVYDSVQSNITIPRWSTSAEDRESPPFDARNVPHGKQEWYINVGGIWQDVTLTAVPKVYIDQVQVTTDIHTGRLNVEVQLAGDLRQIHNSQLTLSIQGSEIATSLSLVDARASYQVNLQVDHPRLWNIDNPHLYTLIANLNNSDDEIRIRFGFREIATRDGQLLLNDEPLFLLAALDQDLYPQTIYTVPSEAFLRDEFEKAKALGVNCLRCHIKPPDPRYLDLADEMGLLVWAEIPSWRTFYQKSTIHEQVLYLHDTIKMRCRTTLEEMIKRDFNHPSLIIWTIVNEDWGTALPLSSDDRAWVAEMYDLCKQLDPTRLVVDNSACPGPWGPNIHVKSDLDDFHVYANIPDQAANFTKMIEQLGLRPLWSFSSYGDSSRTGNEPIILSEFGNWGLPSLENLKKPTGSVPSWFDLGPWWASWEGEPGWPCDVEKRFATLGLDRIWQDYDAMAAATQWHQFEAMKYEIETMRRQPHLAGYVITELSDIYWESNGLLDFDRNPKVYHDKFATINSLDMIAPRLKDYAYWDDDYISIWLYVSHYSATDWADVQLHWTFGDSEGTIDLGTIPRGEVHLIATHRWSIPKVETSRLLPVELEVRNSEGSALASNTITLLVLPASARSAAYSDSVAVLVTGENVPSSEVSSFGRSDTMASGFSTSSSVSAISDETATEIISSKVHRGDFAAAMSQTGYSISRTLTSHTRLIVTDHPDAKMLAWVRDGGDMLYLSSEPGPFFWRQNRGGTFGGSWISSFTWIHPGPHRRLAISNPLTLPFMHIMPSGTTLGLPVYNARFQSDFLAGQVSGWIQHPAVDTVQFRYGKGRVIMTTFSIKQAIERRATDPVGAAMLHDLIDYLTSVACQPTLTANY